MWKHNNQNVGEFVEKDYGHTFTYRKTTDPWALKQGYQHEIDVADDTRFANVTKTRCYMVIDEDSHGKAIVETWKLKKHTVYQSI